MTRESIRSEQKQRATRFLPWVLSAAVVSACTAGGGGVAASPSPKTVESAPASPSGPPLAPATAFEFDNLGSTYPGAETVFVYPGPLDTAKDKQHNATFNNGDVLQAICIATGRKLVPDPRYSESPRPTEVQNKWIKVAYNDSVDHYASLTYGQLIPADARLPECTDVS